MTNILQYALKAVSSLAPQDNNPPEVHGPVKPRSAEDYLFLMLITFDLSDFEYKRLKDAVNYYGDLRVKEAIQ